MRKKTNGNSKNNGAIVIGGHFQGLGAIRALAHEHVHVALVDSEPCIARTSRYICRYFRSPQISNETDYLKFFIDLAEHHGLHGWVLFPTDDETVYFLSKHHSKLSEYFKLITPPWETTQFVYNKKKTYQLAEKMGLPIPKTWYPENESDLDQIDHFPLIIKPAVMRSFYKKTKEKVFCANNRQQLIENYRKAADVIPADEILIQERLSNVTENLFSYCPVIFQDKILGRIVAKRPRQHPMDFGKASTYAITVQCEPIELLGNRFLKAINYYGLGEVEFIYDENLGEYKLLEVNPRIWGWHTIALKAGVNICHLTHCGIQGEFNYRIGYQYDTKWIRLLTDVPVVISEIAKGNLSLKEYASTLQGKKEWAVWSLSDPLPFFTELLLLPYLMIKRGY